jgi:acyl-coenzyme A thioesterase PaaI-like protein
MGRSTSLKKQRHEMLMEKIKVDPFLTDEELSDLLSVSIPTIRLYRMELGIPELRQRIKNVAQENYEKVKTIQKNDLVGELVDLNLGVSGISVLEVTKEMVFKKKNIVRGYFIYSLAESLAMAVIDADAALVGVANIKYKIPVNAGARIVAKAEVKEEKGNKFIVWVKILEKQLEVFRGKFILVTTD